MRPHTSPSRKVLNHHSLLPFIDSLLLLLRHLPQLSQYRMLVRELLVFEEAHVLGLPQLLFSVHDPAGFESMSFLFEQVLRLRVLVKKGDEREGERPEASDGEAGEDAHDPEVVVVVQQDHCLQSLLTAERQLQGWQVEADAHKVQEDVDGSEHASSRFGIVQEEEAFDVGEGEGARVEGGAVVVGEHPLDVVVALLQELVMLELGVQRKNRPGPIRSVFVELVVGEAAAHRFLCFRLVVVAFELLAVQRLRLLVDLTCHALPEDLALVIGDDSLQLLHKAVVQLRLLFKNDEMNCSHELQALLQEGNLAALDPLGHQLNLGAAQLLFRHFPLVPAAAVGDVLGLYGLSLPEVPVVGVIQLFLVDEAVEGLALLVIPFQPDALYVGHPLLVNPC